MGRTLLTTKHPYKTLVIDPITQLYNSTQEKWNRIFEKYAKTQKDRDVQDFGLRYWGKVKSDFKGLQRLTLQLDMNVIVTSHQKDVYGGSFSKKVLRLIQCAAMIISLTLFFMS